MSSTARLQAEAENRSGLDLVSQGKIQEAVTAFGRAAEADPLFSEAHLNLGAGLRLMGRRAEALEALRKALALRPRDPQVLYNLGTTLLDTGDHPGALDAFQEVVSLDPRHSLAHSGMGMALLLSNKLCEAKDWLRKAVVLEPRLHIATHYLGLAHWASGDYDTAIETYKEAIHQDACDCNDCHMALSLALLQRGDYEQGWLEYEWRWNWGGRTPALEGAEQPLWDGSSLAGKTIVLWAEQGLGDILQFVRFAPLVHERGGTVVLLSRPNLDRLLSTCPGVARVVSDRAELGDFDFQLPLASLPRVLGLALEDLPAVEVPYLTPPACRPESPLGPRKDGESRVGIVWGVEKGQPAWEERSCPIELFRELERVPGVELYSLQFGARAVELRKSGAPRAADLSGVLGDFAHTAAIVEDLDLVITVDTSMAHLAGALAKPVWTLIPQNSDWRWLREREDSPWYPTMRLFRQEESGRWEPVMERVVAALQAMRV